MKITVSDLDAIKNGAEALEDLAHLLAQIIRENADTATSREMRTFGVLFELASETSRELKALANKNKSYETATN